MEEYIEKTAWDDFTEPPKEVYIMIGNNGFDIECGLPTGYGDFLKFLKAVERVNRDPEDKLVAWIVSCCPQEQEQETEEENS